MKRLILILILSFCAIFAQGQNVDGNTLRIYESAQIGEDGTIYYLDMHGNVIKNVKDPINPQDAVTKKYFDDNAMVGDRPFVDFEVNTVNPVYKQARLWYDSLRAEMVFYDRVVDLKFGTVGEVSIRVLNNSGGTITKGKAVYPNGSSGGFTTIDLAQANTYATSRPVGFAKNTMLNGEEGWVMLKGVLEGVNTSLLSGGVVYLSPTIAGDLTNTLPSGGDFIIRMGAIGAVGVSDGIINVDPFTNEYTAETISPRGWPKDVVDNTILAPSSGTRTFAIIGDGYVYENGIRYDFSNPSVIWDDTEGTVDIYFSEGVLVAESNKTESEVRDIYTTKPGVSRMYWDALNDTIIYANTMRHTFDMNGNTWAALWDYHKCEIIDGGLGLVDMSVDGTGNVDANAQFGNASALIRNQDIITVIPSQVGTVGYTVFYREGLGGNWRSQDGAPFAILTAGTGRAAWNEDIAGTWQLTEATNGYYLPYVFLTSNTLGDKTGTIMPAAEYATIAEAEVGASETIGALLQGLPIKELKSVAIVIYETRINYTNAVKSRIVSTTTGDDYIDLRFENIVGGGSGGTSTSYIGLVDTQNSYAGFAGQFPVVNPTETGLDFAEAVKTINGQSPTAGNYNITSTANKIGEDVTIGTGDTGVDAVFSVADNDADPTNELPILGNSKLNNDITITSNGTNTTITNIARTDFLNSAMNSASYQLNGTDINTAGTLSNVAYVNQNNTFAVKQSILPRNGVIPTTEVIRGLSLFNDQSNSVGDGVEIFFDHSFRTPESQNRGAFIKSIGTATFSTDTKLQFGITSSGSISDRLFDMDVNGFNINNGGYSIGGTTVIDAFRNIVNTGSGSFGGNVTATNFISNVAIGIPPYATTSTTLNNNLNADLLDDQEGLYYLDYNNFTNTPNLGLYALLTGATFTGSVEATSFIKIGGLSTEFLKADGSVDNNTYLTSVSSTLQEVTDNGATTDVFTRFTGGVSSSGGTSTRFGNLAANSANQNLSWTAIGGNAARDATGQEWVAVGASAAFDVISSDGWVAIGHGAASLLPNSQPATSFSNSVYVGRLTRVSANGVTNENVFGYAATGKGDNTVKLGNDDITEVYMAGNINMGEVLKITPQASAPSSPSLGWIYVNSTNNHIYFYNGTSWVQMDN